jgi:NAD(P)-dependent dehydrogenase (short-subunit alcohol dehydrogenase family)
VTGICEGRTAIVTGAGRGIGRAHALELARQGANVVVNDVGFDRDGSGSATSAPAQAVVEEIEAAGGHAVADAHDVADWDGAAQLVETALTAFGQLDILVNNAGILRDRMLVNMSIEEWDAVIRVHLRGTFAPTRHAAAHWRDQAKLGHPVDARVINTSSGSGLYGNPSQINYGAAKAGIASFTLIAARELERYGVTVNAVAPTALTRMTEGLPSFERAAGGTDFDEFAPENISPVVAWLASEHSRGVSGRVFNVAGGMVGVADGWDRGADIRKAGRWESAELCDVMPGLLARAKPIPPLRAPEPADAPR